MQPDYKNWMPKGMVFGAMAGALVLIALYAVVSGTLMSEGVLKTVLTWVLGIAAVVATGATLWMGYLHSAFSYNGTRQMARQIIDGAAAYVDIPAGGTGLDVGCGSGALAIACAKRNPDAQIVGLDRWGKEYASFSKDLCESNAEAEGVDNVRFVQGNAVKLDFADETFDAVMSNYVYHNISGVNRQDILLETLRVLKKGGTFAIHDIFSAGHYGDMQAFVRKLKDAGYESVELIDTTNGMFMSPTEARWMGLSGSALLVGRK